ncbi:MAG: hypothetical protein JWO22_4060 [Frankiales bacterium]|nr:hypothetical protein [Frankiales bacterium]
MPKPSRMVRLSSRRVCSTALLAVLAGCGTTVPAAQQGGYGSGGGSSLVDGSSTTGASAGGTTSGLDGSSTAGSTAGSVSAGGTGSSGTSGTGGATGAGTSGTGGLDGSTSGVAGTTSSGGGPANSAPLKVGVFYLNGGNQVISSAFPGSSVSFGDGKREATAIIDDINKRHLAGAHKLVPVWIAIEATDNDASRQQKCLGAVQDNHPVALMAIFNLTEGLAKCVQQSSTLMIDVALGAGDEHLYSQAKNLAFSPSQMTRDAEQKLVLTLAHQQGELPAGKTVGLIDQSDDPMYPRVMRTTVIPLLKSWGVPYIEQSLSSGSDTSGMYNAVLKFKTSKVDTVVFSLGSGGIPEVLFMQSADQQQFRPAYLMGDSTDTNFVGSQAPAAQIKRISGAGTYPLANVQADQYPSSANERKRLAVLNKAIGGYNSRYSSLTGTLYCEILYSFAFVADRTAGVITSSAWSQTFHALGSAYQPVTTFSTRFRPGRPDGASGYRALGYGAACNCITYTSPVRAVPAS